MGTLPLGYVLVGVCLCTAVWALWLSDLLVGLMLLAGAVVIYLVLVEHMRMDWLA